VLSVFVVKKILTRGRKEMKNVVKILVMLSLAVFFTASIASATLYSFGDDSIYWPGWENTDTYPTPVDNDRDYIGDPNFTGGEAEVIDGYLRSLRFDQDKTGTVSILAPGDLFLNVNANNDTTWDYVVDLSNWPASSKSNPDVGEDDYNIYSVVLDLGHGGTSIDNPGYILSGTDNTGGWSGWYIRDNHPVAASGIEWQQTAGLRGKADFSGWPDTLQTSYLFEFAHGLIAINEPFTIGWTANCANDVIYETVNPVPEPATMFLLGTGLIGLAGIGRKKLIRIKR
jgi:hypothetical protein